MQKNSMNKNWKENSMRRRTTPMNLNQKSNKKKRKTHRSICDKGIQKHTSLYRNGVQMRDTPNGMARNPKEKIVNLSHLMRRDSKIRTPLDRSTSNVWHNVIKGRRLILRIKKMLDQRHPKSIGHYRRTNDVLFTLYPTLHMSVGIIGVDREVWVELSNQ